MSDNESAEQQIDRLAKFIMEKIPGEPSEDQGAVDTAIRLLSSLDERDGFTTPCVVDLQSGTWMDAKTCVIVNLTSDQSNRFADMSDSERVTYAIKHGKSVFYLSHFNWDGEVDNEGQKVIYTGEYVKSHLQKDVVFKTREEAELVLTTMFRIFNKNGVLYLTEFYNMIGIPDNYTHIGWAWTSLDNIKVRQVRDGYLIELPPLEKV